MCISPKTIATNRWQAKKLTVPSFVLQRITTIIENFNCKLILLLKSEIGHIKLEISRPPYLKYSLPIFIPATHPLYRIFLRYMIQLHLFLSKPPKVEEN